MSEIEEAKGNSLSEWATFIMMFILIITMVVVGIIIWKYGSAVKADPCSFCDCTYNYLKGGLR